MPMVDIGAAAAAVAVNRTVILTVRPSFNPDASISHWVCSANCAVWRLQLCPIPCAMPSFTMPLQLPDSGAVTAALQLEAL